jgi:transposase
LGITKTGNRVVRTQLIESSQTIVIGSSGIKSKRTIVKQKVQDVRVIAYAIEPQKD